VHKTLAQAQSAAREIHPLGVEELVADKGYHSGEVLETLRLGGVRSYIPEPERGKRKWEGEAVEQKRTYEPSANRDYYHGLPKNLRHVWASLNMTKIVDAGRAKKRQTDPDDQRKQNRCSCWHGKKLTANKAQRVGNCYTLL
jgi:hypothetical protein